MISFESDYIAAAHDRILQRLTEAKDEIFPGYGTDRYCESAKEKIRAAFGCPQADVHFLVGGTQTNSTIIAALLKSYEGVVAAESGHVNVHESGAVEYTGHKVLTLPQHQGKLDSVELENYLGEFFADEENCDHMVFPGMVYISFPTEYGTLYTKEELKNIHAVCRKYELPLFIDGARLGYGLMSRQNDITPAELAENCDVFYIGGTKVGALCGEAVVFTHNNAPKHFFTEIKQHGALLAKGRLLGVQFDTLFTDNLYFEISRNAIKMADKMRAIFKEKGYRFFMETVTNQIFIILENSKMEELKEKVAFGFWEKYDDDHTVVRFASSWATTEEAVGRLSELL